MEKLKKQLGFMDVFSLAAGAMISSGLFVLPAVAYDVAGSGIVIAYFLAGLLMLPAIFSQLELSTAIPKAGGTYFYIDRILGPLMGIIAGFGNWFSISLKSAFALIGIGAFATLVFPGITDLQIKLIAIGACVFFTATNLFSTHFSGKIQVVFVIFLLGILGVYIGWGYNEVDFSHFKDLSNTNLSDIFATTGMVFISFGGLTKIASMAEEVKDVKKNLRKGMFYAFVVVEIIYILCMIVLIGVMEPASINKSLTPISSSSFVFAGNIGLIVTAIAAMFAFITTANSGIMSASRSPLAMSRDSSLPNLFGKVSKQSKTPFVSILLTSAFMILVITFLDLKNLAKVASLFMLLLFILVNFSLIVIRFSKISNYKPTFKSPLFPVIQIIGILAYLFLIVEMGLITTIIAAGFIILCVIWYFVYAKRRVKTKSALVHMIENLVDKEIVEDEVDLEKELLNILIERNEIVEDRFDEIIRKATILDLDKSLTREELFSLLSKRISEKWNIAEEQIEKKLKEREEESSTLIYPGIAVPHAIPHIIIEGEHCFDIFVVRAKHGIKWNEEDETVYTVFCLMGSKDERNFHLRALAAIAQIIQNVDFNIEWMKARNVKELRSVLLLSQRKRHHTSKK